MKEDPIIKGAFREFEAARELLEERGQTYGGLTVDDYMPFGLESYVQMVHLKSSRAVSTLKQGRPAEDLLDSLRDLINYAAFAAAKVSLEMEGTTE